MSQSISDGSF